MKVILFNGPPRSGKDTAADILYNYFAKIQELYPKRYAFARPLKETTHALYGIKCEWDAFEYTKDREQEKFFGLSPRQAYIKVSEEMVKPVLGKEHWGNVFLNYVDSLPNVKENIIIVSDCGFIEEIQPIKKKIGSHNMFLINVVREGTNFKNDSRSYIDDPSIPGYILDNNEGISELSDKMKMISEIIIGMCGIE